MASTADIGTVMNQYCVFEMNIKNILNATFDN